MKAKIVQYVAATCFALLMAVGIASLPEGVAVAGSAANQVLEGVNKAGGEKQTGLAVQIQNVINVLLFIIGVISVIMIIIGGIKYVLSNGDSSQIKSAKDTIMYAVIGLVIALLAYAIVNFVVNAFAK